MELIIKETKIGHVKEESRPQEPQFKIENDTLVRCELNGCTTVTIPAEVKTIGRMCFAVTAVEEVILPEGMESIESQAFVDCNKLRKINFPKGLKFIKDRSFMNCSSLTEVTLPENLTELGDFAFYSAGIEQLTLPNPKNVLSTGINVFGAIKIKSINVPKNFKLSEAMFSNCQQLRSVNLESNWVLIPKRCFYYCTNLAEIDISKALFIKEAAFHKCYSLSVNVIPAHTCVSACAFMETGVEDVTIEDISMIEERAFSECTSLKRLTINVPDGLAVAAGLSIPEKLAAYCTSLQTVTFTGHPENLLGIEASAFRDAKRLTEISLPNNIQTIGQYAFCDSGIKTMHLPEELRQIGNGAFALSNIKNVVIPDKVASLGKEVFSKCYELTDVTFPKSVTAIPKRTFMNCYNLKTVNVSDITVVGNDAFCNCEKLTAFDFSQVKELETMSFASTGICKAVFSNKLAKLQSAVFCNCENLQSVDMSACNKIKTISANCFGGCSRLKDIKLPPNICELNEGCFVSVKLDKLVIKAGTRINYYAFSEAVINELEFDDDADEFVKTIVDLRAFKNAKVGRLIIPDHMYGRFKEAIDKMQ